MTSDLIYMDHAATTPTAPQVLEGMLPWFSHSFGNSASVLHSLGRKSAEAVEEARAKAAALIGAAAEEVYFTGGGTESDNWAVIGAARANSDRGRRLIVSSVEHHAVLEAAEFLSREGFEAALLPVDSYGMVHPEAVENAITDDTTLVSVMHGNNEVGTVNPIGEIGSVCRRRGVLFHTDAVQSVGKLPVDVKSMNVDLLSASAHKFGGPKGCGFLYVRSGVDLDALLHGGAHERGRRAGTLNVPAIVGLGVACELAAGHLEAESERVASLRDRLQEGVLERIPDVSVNGHPTQRLPGLLNLSIDGVEGEAVVLSLDAKGLCASSGSACTTGSAEASHVLLAMGVPAHLAHGSLRLSLGSANTPEHIPGAIDRIAEVIERLRAMSPTYKPGGGEQ